jgi:hypothetical protein
MCEIVLILALGGICNESCIDRKDPLSGELLLNTIQ